MFRVWLECLGEAADIERRRNPFWERRPGRRSKIGPRWLQPPIGSRKARRTRQVPAWNRSLPTHCLRVESQNSWLQVPHPQGLDETHRPNRSLPLLLTFNRALCWGPRSRFYQGAERLVRRPLPAWRGTAELSAGAAAWQHDPAWFRHHDEESFVLVLVRERRLRECVEDAVAGGSLYAKCRVGASV